MIPIGERIHVIGLSCSGKSTLAAHLARALDANFVDLDAINWLPDWVALNETDRPELERRFRAATQGRRWVTAGSYTATAQRAFWPRLDTIVWLDLPGPLLVWRCLRRSWRRWRTKELLWGTNIENFWRHLAVWREESLLWWIVTQYRRKRRNTLAAMVDPRWSHIRFVRLWSPTDVDAFAEAVANATAVVYPPSACSNAAKSTIGAEHSRPEQMNAETRALVSAETSRGK